MHDGIRTFSLAADSALPSSKEGWRDSQCLSCVLLSSSSFTRSSAIRVAFCLRASRRLAPKLVSPGGTTPFHVYVAVALVLPTVLTAVVEQHDALQLQGWCPSQGVRLTLRVSTRCPYAPHWTRVRVQCDVEEADETLNVMQEVIS